MFLRVQSGVGRVELPFEVVTLSSSGEISRQAECHSLWSIKFSSE
jgi:hypothetical protein